MSNYQLIPLDKIVFPEQERKHFDPLSLEALAATIKQRGVLQPIGVYADGDRYVIVWGQRRAMSAKLAGETTIPAIVREKPAADADAIEIRLIENLARQSLRPIEQAMGLRSLQQARGITDRQLAQRVGMHPTAVCKSLSLLNLSEPIRRQVEEGTISPSAAYELARVKDAAEQAELATKVASGELGRDSLIAAIKQTKRRASKSHGKQKGATARLVGNRQVTVRGDDLTVGTFIAALEDLLARCRTARTKGLSLRTLLRVLSEEAHPSTPEKGA